MRAVVLVAPGVVALDEQWPEPVCGPDEVIVAVRGVGLCGSDLSVVAGHRAVPGLPWVLGHEGYGEIVSVGSGVTDRRPGQVVVIEPNYPCLDCSPCRSGATSGCAERRIVGITEPGLLAERVAVPAAFTWPVPPDWAAEDVVCVEPLSVALHALELAAVDPGERCLVIGAGSQGQLVALAARRSRAVVHVIEPHPGRLALARSLGALEDDAGEYPIVIETSGVPSAFEQALARVAPGGRVIVIGQSTVPAEVATFTLVQRRLTIRGCLIYDHPGGFTRTIMALGEADLRPGRVLQARFDATEAARAFAEAGTRAGKTWITFEEMA
jgi:2-desacetyl-2-hydroxyethyl bacteriochlorophyllide A dehydrogenase